MPARRSASFSPSVVALGEARRRRLLARHVGELPLLPLTLALVAAAAVMVSHLLDFGVGHLRVALLDANAAGSLSHLLADAVAVALTGIALGGTIRRRREPWMWGLTTIALAFLAAGLSPRLAHVDELSRGKLLYVPALVVLSVCLWRLSSRAADGPGSRIGLRRSRLTAAALLIRIGLAAVVLSFAIQLLGPRVLAALGWSAGSWAYQVEVGVREASELAGLLLMACGLAPLSRLR